MGRTGGIVVAAITAFGAAACEQPVPEAVEVVRPVKMLQLAGGADAEPLEYPGRIAATTDAEIAFEVGGLITEFPVVQGQLVREGDLLAQIDSRDFQANLDAVRAERNVARADYARYQDLFAADAASLQELEVARRRFEVAEAQIQTAEKAVSDTTLVAPFSGRVARKLVEAFQGVGAREPILVLQDVEDTLDVIINIPENDVAIKPDLTIEELEEVGTAYVELTSYPGRRFAVRPKEFASEADPITRTFEITFSFEPPDDVRILPGMTSKLLVDPDIGTGSFTIPAAALAAGDGGQPFVWVIDRASMTVAPRDVEVGELMGDNALVTEGLSGSDTIAVSAVQNLRDGMEVREIQY